MLRHYLVMAVRSLARHKLYSFINVAGLSIALACAILILLFVRDQLSYDDWIPGTANLYRLEVTWHMPGQLMATALSPFPVLNAMKAEIPGVRAVTHLVPEQLTITVGVRQFLETVTVVDPNFLQVIRLPLAAGDPARVLAAPESIVLSQSMARKYFGSSDPVGRFLQVSGVVAYECSPNDRTCFSATHSLRVSGVLRDLPHDTQLIADFLMPNTSQADELSPTQKQNTWNGTLGNNGYIELAPGVDPMKVLSDLRPILDRSVNTDNTALTGSEMEQYTLTPYRSVHLTSGKLGDMKPPVDRTTVYGFAAIALLIILVACCNFMNLATARATLRAREIGLRKVVGAKRRELAAQFLVEAVCTTLVSLAIALSLVEILLPFFSRFLDEPIGLHYLSNRVQLGGTIVGAVVVGLLSGAYPAMVLSGFRPVSTLSANGAAHVGSGLLRSMLVVGQFVVSIGLGIAAIVIFRQIHFARSVDLGFNRYGMVVIDSISNLPADARVRLARVLSIGPGIAGTALSNAVPFDTKWTNNVSVHAAGDVSNITAHLVEASPEFPSVYGMRLLAGRLLSADRGQDVSASPKNVLVDAAAARALGFTIAGAVGKTIDLGSTHLTIVGVLNDAMSEGLRSAVWPVIYMVDTDDYNSLSVRVRGDRLAAALAFIDGTWRSFAPRAAMQRYLMSDVFDGLFTSDERQGTMFVVFVTIAILIACLGLFGLVVFTAERRTKEVGIRKISGARTTDIVTLMLWRISVPVLLANLIAWPVAYYYLHRWLEGYAYRISLNPLYFAAAGAAALLIAWATVCANTLRLARASPVHALRYE
jgi:putative ABC transport system permease protein